MATEIPKPRAFAVTDPACPAEHGLILAYPIRLLPGAGYPHTALTSRPCPMDPTGIPMIAIMARGYAGV